MIAALSGNTGRKENQMKSKHFKLTLKEGIKNLFIVVGVYPDYVWENGKSTEEIKGYKLKTVCPSASYDTTIIKMETARAPLDPDAVNDNPVTVPFEGLEFSSYINPSTGKTDYVGKATGIKVINN